MDRATKSAIRRLVLNLRHLLEDDIEIVLKRYGLFTDRAWLAADKIPKANAEVLTARRRMEAAIAVEQARGLEPGEATRWYVREMAFTYLNRLVGLKCLEVRALIEEVIITRVEYGGRSLFHRDFRHAHPDLATQSDDALPAALEAACRRVTDEMIGVLFDPDSESSIVWPRYQTLREVIGLINNLSAGVWAEDEIVGWVYQFYNAEEKERIRKRGKPKLPIEVAVINQFFTPRWVVKFLVDNTLGRLWLEMHPDSERVQAKCDYLVPEPLSVDEDKGAEGQGDKEIVLDPGSPINNPQALPRRDSKPVTEIRLIDPACGTMHFGHYAFEVFREMYHDSLEHGWPITIDDLRLTIDERDALIENRKSEIPNLILRHNLYGVDIDLRAVQLAALSLYMKAQLAEDEAFRGQPGAQRAPRNTYRVNLVCADACLTDGEVRARFLKEYEDDPALQKVWRELFREMEDIAQVGSLLRVEERFHQLLQEYRPASVELDVDRQLALDDLPQQPRQMDLAEMPGATTWSAHRTLIQMLEHLRRFARDALEEADINAQLFAAETKKTLGLLDVLVQDYDVVAMNPPYGFTTRTAKSYLKTTFPDTNNNLYAAFMERTCDLVKNGFVGALVSRTFLYMRSFKYVRMQILLAKNSLITLAELGLGTLDDATVRPAGLVYEVRSGPRLQDKAVFFGLAPTEVDAKQKVLENGLRALRQGLIRDNVFVHPLRRFQSLPALTIAYWASETLLTKFEESIPLDSGNALWGNDRKQIAMVRRGLGTGQDSRFVRFFWEIPHDQVGRDWPSFAKGGFLSPYYRDLELVVDWRNGGKALREFPKSYLRSEHLYFAEGLTYTLESEKDSLGAYYLRPDCIIGDKGPGILPLDKDMIWTLLGILNSWTIAAFIRILTPDRTRTVGFVSSLPLPLDIPQQYATVISKDSKSIYELKKSWDSCNEICTCFTQPWLLQLAQLQGDASAGGLGRVLELLDDDASPHTPAQPIILKALLDRVRAIETAANIRLQQLQAEIDEAVYDLYEISPEDRALIEEELDHRPPELVWPQMENKSDQEKRREHVRRLLSYFVLQAIKADQDGVLPLVENTSGPTVLGRLRERLETTFGADVAFQLEDDAGQVLGRSVDKWLDKPFIQWHTKLYKRRPIVWHIASPRGTFGALVYYHKLDRDTLPKVRNVYLRTLRDWFAGQLEQARSDEDYKTVDRLEAALDDLTVLGERLAHIIEAGYDPVIDDGVKANILPLQEAGVLRHRKVV